MVWIFTLLGCGGKWSEDVDLQKAHADFAWECTHATLPCESCHDPSQELTAADPACLSCHEADRPASHDPATTSLCEECHTACDWTSTASPHPAGFAEPEAHGLQFVLQDQTEGDCRECHGADLEGDTARSCTECHANEGHAGWRTECTFCHGGTDNATGAPPRDIAGAGDAAFGAHSPHVDDNGDYRALPCNDCHEDKRDVMDPGHVYDDTPGVSEVTFLLGIAPRTVQDGDSCETSCHGQGQGDLGVVTLSDGSMTCESCHSTDSGWASMSGLHNTHLSNDSSIVCADCHAAVMNPEGTVGSPGRHVDGKRDVAFRDDVVRDPTTGTCDGSCHGTSHASLGWGHAPGYDEPERHGIDANLQVLDCQSCHGQDLTGASAIGCDDCHTTEGHADWRTDCTFCHGGVADNTGAPPQDIDDLADESRISFDAHPEHSSQTGLGHPQYDCTECHRDHTDALSNGHMFDGTALFAEVTLTGGLSTDGGWDRPSSTCSNLYCHGDGRAPSGDVADGSVSLTCDDCHRTASGWDQMSGTHDTHLQEGITCSECHSPVVDAQDNIVRPARHVDGTLDIDAGATGRDAATGTCTVVCHDTDHRNFGWLSPHPAGYDAPTVHGQEALAWAQDCTPCHGADLRGDSAQGCDTCHANEGHADWRTDCIFCHGGAGNDTAGAPPEDLDNQTDPTRISFMAHRTHLDGDEHPTWGCETCHGQASASYTDAFTDPGHWIDATSGFAENRFTGLASGTTYATRTCSNNKCHGNGQELGSQVDSANPIGCNGCHRYDSQLTELSGSHASHMAAGTVCADCHADVNAAGQIVQPNQHVDGDVDFDAAATGYDAPSDTCTVVCHDQDHNAWSWEGGHPPGYDQPEMHGTDSLLIADCQPCHGDQLGGGSSGQGCDTCHDPGWNRDCTYCHGGTLDNTGMPPQDLDNTTDETQITFRAHPEHGDNDDHPLYGCRECHGAASANYTDAITDAGHWFGGVPGVSEVTFSGVSPGGTYSNGTCTVYCHGNGNNNGSQADSNNGLSCTGCHLMPNNTDNHRDHEHNRYPCAECHADTVNTSDAIIDADRHVDGVTDVRMNPQLNSVTYTASTRRCSGSCHGEGHSSERW